MLKEISFKNQRWKMKLFYNYLDHVTLALGIKGKKKIKIHKHEFPFKNSEL